MRFFAHDGKTTHGPAGIDELLKLPGFDGDTLICPVGSNDTADWKPAVAYPPFKKALLESVAVAPPAPPAAAPASPLFTPIDSPNSPKSMLAPLDSPRSASPILPLPAIQPMQPLPPQPPPVVKTAPCPACKHPNLMDARFCNACAARMDGKVEPPNPAPVEPAKALVPPSAPPPFPVPMEFPKLAPPPVEPPSAMPSPLDLPQASANPFDRPASPAPVKDPFAHLDPMLNFPAEPTPAVSFDSPKRPLKPAKMGQLAAFDEPLPVASAPALAPDPEPAVAVPVWKRPLVLAAFAVAAVLSAGAAYMMLGKTPSPVEAVAELTPSATPPVPEASPAPAVYAPPPMTASPLMPSPRSTKAKTPPAAKPKRARKPRPARVHKAVPATLEEPGAGDTLIESRAPEEAPKPEAAAKKGAKAAEQDPLLEALLSDATQGGADAVEESPKAAAAVKKEAPTIGQRPAAKPSEFSLPGLSRPVSASDRAITPPKAAAEPSKPGPRPGIEDEAAKPAEGGDQLALMQVHEQFDFCSQLLSQGAFGDHYDTCLCKEAREASPYRGRRGYYVTAKKKEAGAGHLETTAKILTSKLDGGVASVTARWKATGADKGRTSSQTWKLEDGLWCQAP